MSDQVQTLVALVLPILGCWSWLRLLTALHLLERLALSIGIGIAASSVEFFLWRLFGAPLAPFPLIDAAGWAVVAALGLTRRGGPAIVAPAPTGSVHRLIWVTMVVAVAWLAIGTVVRQPQGAWDAWAIWNHRAAFLADPTGHWKDGFDETLSWSHPDYPLLVPAAVARVWAIAGARGTLVPIGIALSFTLASALLLVGALARTSSPTKLQAAFGLLMTPLLVTHGASQCADIPLGFFVLATAVLLGHDSAHRGAPLMLAGATAGCAAWTKNEGLIFALALPSIYLVECWRRRGTSAAVMQGRDLILGAAPMVLVVASFKLLLAPSNDLVSGFLSPGVLEMRLGDTQRIAFVASYMLSQGLGWGGWPIPGPVPIALAVGAFNRGVKHEAQVAAGLALVVQILVLFTVYVMTPHSVAWHLSTSWGRLVAQMWPTLVWWALAPSSPARSRSSLVVR